jgi:hypothetical protein
LLLETTCLQILPWSLFLHSRHLCLIPLLTPQLPTYVGAAGQICLDARYVLIKVPTCQCTGHVSRRRSLRQDMASGCNRLEMIARYLFNRCGWRHVSRITVDWLVLSCFVSLFSSGWYIYQPYVP